MARIAVIYFSAMGTTASLARAVHAGANEVAESTLCEIIGGDIQSGRFQNQAILEIADAADGIVFGCPTYMGGPAAQFKAFADATSDRWSAQQWSNKVAAGFTTGSCANGDQANTIAYFTILSAQHGMLWCSLDIPGDGDQRGLNRLGNQLGLVTQAIGGTLEKSDLETGAYLGKRLATIATRLAKSADSTKR